jgi:cyanate permease
VVLLPPLFGVLFDLIDSWPGTWLAAVGLTILAGLAMALAPRRLPASVAAPATPAGVGPAT